MATSVRISTDTKDKLEQLQAEIKLETGRKVTQQEVLDRAVNREFDSRKSLIDSFRDDYDGLSEAEIDQFLSGTSDWGIETSEEDVDRILYGEAPQTNERVSR
ncbi:hypothetical protein HLRTI_000644 [Halorhabdus tiamatea SARL4B]|uniref:Uncharacterized protein n=1 Tax=Halorhabdus tiamatea SARL4B TaxID=1033806 RepID=F7PG29_9EURY|nr:hypothetical protein [Halorhabdus tiamatea]ERJ07286.1 hypothetical protein HLRTI_000644 [Halorhabdus tiamatea SARL4B]CCQ34196.1 conserved hypothetical protein [Halorhabdus tiamatea SARL4B]